MNPRSSTITVTDLFCGAGGSSTGAVQAGAEVRIAANHWQLAIETHNTNHPNVQHVLADISADDPRRYASTDVLIASPECTWHSNAKGIKRVQAGQLSMFEEKAPDPAADRSRVTMWDVVRFTERHNYRVIVVENVVEVRYWPPFESWLKAMHSFGYEHKIVYFNSMFAHPTPQSRDRVYIVFWKKGNKRPNLNFYPPAYCPKCDTNVSSHQAWKKPDKKFGKYGTRQQYVYVCPDCGSTVTPYYYAAANAIDWSDPGELIRDRKKPLKERTMARIRHGLEKYSGSFVQRYDGTHQHGTDDPMYAQTTRETQGIVSPPFLVETAYTHAGDKRVYDIESPLNTQSTRQTMGVVMPFIIEFWGSSKSRPVEQPLSTVEAGANHHGFIMPPFLLPMATWRERAVEMDEPMPTQTTRSQPGLVMSPSFLINSAGDLNPRPVTDPLPTQPTKRTPFLIRYYGNDEGAHSIFDPLGTQPTVDRHGLVSPGEIPEPEDCYFRMLKPVEIQRAMAFPNEYVILGSTRDKICQLGNAVTPPVMRMIMERVMATFA